jgi:heptaprenyl diphosphate synthase
MSIRKLTRIAILVALASVLHAIEALIPVPYVLPGAKLGLANVVALYLIMVSTFSEALTVNFLRTLLGSLLSGTFLSVGYFLSLSGALFSTLVMYGVRVLLNGRISVVGVSVLGAIAHNLAQLLTTSLILRQIGVLFYLPYLLFFAIPTGIFIGLITGRLLRYSRRSPAKLQ